MPPRLATATAVVVVAVLCLPASADQGVSVDLGRVRIDDHLRAGQRYRLPTLGVSNPGTERGSYEVFVGTIEGKIAAPESWFRLQPRSFDLDPGETQPVEVELVLPPDADPARYEQLVSARLVVDGSGGATVGAAAASILTFEVVPTSILEGLWVSAVSFFLAGLPWTTLAVAALALSALLAWVSRNFEVSMRRRE